MQLLGWWQKHESSTTSRRCFVNFTGFQSIRESGTSWWWQFTSAYTDWRRRTYRRLSDNLCHCWQATPTVCWHRVSVSTKDKDHAEDEEFHGQRYSQLEQFTPAGTIRNSPPWPSFDIWRPICLADQQHGWGLCMMHSTNLLINHPTSHRWTVYVAPKSPKGWHKNAISLFVPVKFNFCRIKSATKFLCMKTSSGKVVAKSFPYPTVHRSIAGDVPIYLKLAFKVTHPFRKLRFPKLSFSCASTMKASSDTFCDRNLAQRTSF